METTSSDAATSRPVTDRGAPAAADPGVPHEPMTVPHTRTGAAWMAVITGLVLTLLMLVFILQNGDRVPMKFLWMDFSVPLGVGLLLAGVIGALIVVSLGVARLVQLRLAARRHRRMVDRSPSPRPAPMA